MWKQFGGLALLTGVLLVPGAAAAGDPDRPAITLAARDVVAAAATPALTPIFLSTMTAGQEFRY